MAFVLLKTDDNEDYYCSTANIAGIRARGGVELSLQKGPRLLDGPGPRGTNLQNVFRLSAGRDEAAAAAGLVRDIVSADQSGTVLDLRERCVLPDRNSPVFR